MFAKVLDIVRCMDVEFVCWRKSNCGLLKVGEDCTLFKFNGELVVAEENLSVRNGCILVD
jgi:hypothetical protein